MKAPLLWVVVPCHREQQLPWVLEQYQRQVYSNKKLCIVENGDAIGACSRLGLAVDLVVTSRTHVSHARNEGMYAIRDMHDDGWLCMWDDDDWYGPGYLEEMAELVQSGRAEVYGKHRHFVAFPDNGLYLFNEFNQNKYTDYVHGPTLVFRAADGVIFRVQREAEEVRWCGEMRRLGARVWGASIYHQLYLRYGAGHGHAWKAQDGIVLRASQKNDYFYWLGDVDVDIVTGAVPWRSRIRAREGQRTPPPFVLRGKGTKIKVLPQDPSWVKKPVWSTVPVARM